MSAAARTSADAILVVDDSLTVRMDLADAFEAAGLRALPCATLGEARAVLERERPAAVILDVVLPDGDGVAFLHELRGRPDTVSAPVLVLSSEAEVRDRIRGLTTGADEYVGKPYDAGYVVARTFELVRARRAATGDAAPVPATVLVIDDSPTFRESLREVLSDAGYRVLTAASGEEGLRCAADHRPDAMVVDGVLPGIDGPTVIRRVRLDAALRGTPCLLFTGAEDLDAELNALDAGADAFVTKNEDPAVILARLAAALRQAAAGPTSKQTESLLGPKKILAVDDSPSFLQDLAAALRSDEYDVVTARSGEEALELLSVERVDCILLDLMMPGIGGHETCRRIKASPAARDIPLVLLTALDDQDAMLAGLAMGADDYITKSSELEVVRARVRAQLRRKQFEDENRRIREELLRKELEAQTARSAREVAEARASLVEELERKNRELEAFSYSVSHDLRTPLRGIDGFSHALLADYGDVLDDRGKDYLNRVRKAAQRMGELIDDMLALARVSRAEINAERVDLGAIARGIAEDLAAKDPERACELVVADPLIAVGDRRLLRVLLENLLGNAWKFTAKAPAARIEIGSRPDGAGDTVYFVRDNGAGFNMDYAAKLFRPFQRLHAEADFPGTGIGLATVHRIIERHGGRVWAEGAVGEGATISFTLPAGKGRGPR
jgi:DNA-binding response OmpR family regulator